VIQVANSRRISTALVVLAACCTLYLGFGLVVHDGDDHSGTGCEAAVCLVLVSVLVRRARPPRPQAPTVIVAAAKTVVRSVLLTAEASPSRGSPLASIPLRC
jgi:hypothetical protein